ncbi:hypothetical protein CR513_15544, partial [Mucuna pruriens]
MESKVETLEQQNQDLKGEVGQLREQMAQMFQILSQTNVAVTTLANQNAAKYAQAGYAAGPPPCNVRDPPCGMPQGWNTKNPANEEQEQQNAVNNGPVFNASSRASPNTKEDPGAQHQTSGNVAPFSLEEHLRAIEGGDKYGLEAVDLCLVLDVRLPADFKTPEFDK